MIIRKAPEFRYSDITPKHIYRNRRRFLATAAIGGGAGGQRERSQSVQRSGEEPTEHD